MANQAFGMGIFNVVLGSINNTTAGAADGYQDYSCATGTTLTIGQDYFLTVTTNDNADENVRAWLDLNNDGQLNATTELIFSSSGRGPQTRTVRIPAAGTVLNTPLRLRVAADYVNAPVPTPCSTPQYSQTEDYRVTLQAATQAPVAAFAASQLLTCSGCVQFTDQTQNAPTSWLWNFGDNTTSTQQNPNHCYAAPGTYTVALTSTNVLGANTLTRANYITYNGQAPVAAACTPATTGFCCGYGITQVRLGSLVNNSADAAAGYEDFTCAQRLTVPVGSRTAWAIQTGGTNPHDVKAYLDLNDDGQFGPSELLLSAMNQRNPSGGLLWPGSAVLNRPLRLRIVADAVGSGASACANVTLGQAEDYTVTLTANMAEPSAQAVSSFTAPSCDTLFQFTDRTANLPTSWLWTFGDGTSSTQQHPQHAYTEPGTYKVRLRVCNATGCDTLAAPLVVQVNGRAVRPASCQLTVSIPGNSPEFSIREFQLHSIDNVTGDATEGYGDFTCSHRALLAAGGRYPVLVRSPYAIYNFRSRVWIDYNNDGLFAEPGEVVFDGTADAPLHRGFIQVPASAVTNVPLRVRVLGAYDGSFMRPCGTSLYGQVEDYSVIILPASVPIEPWFTVGAELVCAGTPVTFQLTNQTLPAGATVQWSFGDGATSTQLTPSHTYTSAGPFTARATLCTPAGCRTSEQSVPVVAAHVTTPNTCAGITGQEGWGRLYGIDSVAFGTLRHKNQDFDHIYRDLSCSLNSALRLGQPYLLTVVGYRYEERAIRVYLDANNDGTLSPSEILVTGATTPDVNAFAQLVTIPPTVPQGVPLRLRVMTDSDFSATGACGVAQGQILDFSVTVSSATAQASSRSQSPSLYVTPNPATETCVVHHGVAPGKNIQLTIWNMTGQRLYRATTMAEAIGQTKLPLSSLNLKPDVYVLQVESGEYQQRCKLVITH